MELFELKLLFIKVRCLINLIKICALLRNGWKMLIKFVVSLEIVQAQQNG